MKKIIAVCDPNERYAVRLSDALTDRLGTGFTVSSFTDAEKLSESAGRNGICLLVISGRMFADGIGMAGIDDVLLLGEKGELSETGYSCICKYQSREGIVREIAEYLSEKEIIVLDGTEAVRNKLTVIGVYSPVKRCLQTTFALTVGEQLAKDSRVLYMNFEGFSGFSGLMHSDTEGTAGYNITDLLYFFDCAREKLPMKLETMVRTVNGMDFLPPAGSYFDTYERSGEMWVELFRTIEKCSVYDYLILDLSEAVQGLLQILTYCTKIFTIIRSDRIASAKICEYEKWMRQNEASGVAEKTVKCELPVFHDIPDSFEMLTHGEMADYIRGLLSEGDAA